MLLSMTGFGKAVGQYGDKKIVVEVKSLNSKQMDLSMRLPQSYREHELAIRQLIGQSLQRGKADALIYAEGGDNDTGARININTVKSYYRQINDDMARALNLPPLTSPDIYKCILRLPDIFKTDTPTEVSKEEYDIVLATTAEALKALTSHRRAEGEKLEHFFAQRISLIGDMLAKVPDYEQERLDKIRTRVTEALEKVSADVDHVRLEQEMIYYIEKLDVTEEKQRLGQHLHYFLDTMNSSEPGQGKKLGFIAQEMGREINTLGSKSNHSEMQNLVVNMKDNLEQIKEQVLNVL